MTDIRQASRMAAAGTLTNLPRTAVVLAVMGLSTILSLQAARLCAEETKPEPSAVQATETSDPLLQALPQFDPEVQPEDVRPHVEFLASDQMKGRQGANAIAAAMYLETRFRELGLRPLFEDSYRQQIPGPRRGDGVKYIYGQNVGAWLPGSDPDLADEYVIISAHYDHLGQRGDTVYPGADDNASGTSMLLELARRYSQMKTPPRRSMVFVGFDLEEHLLWGSRWFVAHPPWPIESVKFFMTADMIGRSLGDLPINTIFVLGGEHGSGISDVMDTVGEPRGFHVARMGIDLIGTRSDYGPFRDQQIPFLFFSTGEHPDYHQPTDTPDRINYEQVAAVSSLVLRVTDRIANADTAPEWIDELTPQKSEVEAVHRIATLLLEADERASAIAVTSATQTVGGSDIKSAGHAEPAVDGSGKVPGVTITKHGESNSPSGQAKPLTSVQRFIVKQAEVQTRQILQRGEVTPSDRATLIRLAQVLLFSVL